MVYAASKPVNMSNQRHQVTATRLSPDGYGVALQCEPQLPADVEFFVQDLLPGESAWVEIAHQSAHKPQVWAKIVERCSELSASRVTPACPAFGECGGCAWQHLDRTGQLAEKRNRVQAELDAHLNQAPELLPPSPGATTHYRNKGKYVVAKVGDRVVLGAYKPRSHEIVSTLGCQVVEAPIARIASAMAEHLTALQPEIYDEGTPAGQGLRYLIMRANGAGELLILLVCTTATSAAAMAMLATAALAEPGVVGVLRCDNDSTTGVLLTEAITPLCGSATLAEIASGYELPLGPAAFWQLNRAQAAKAFGDLAQGLALPDASYVVELYCGVGAISFALAKHGYRVLGVESNSEATATARAAAAAAGLDENLRFLEADATALEPSLLAQADAIVVDPPRKGLGNAGRAQLIRAKPQVIAYLSCGPESLAKDLAALVLAGYELESVRLYDFMPGTSQVESLAILRLGSHSPATSS